MKFSFDKQEKFVCFSIQEDKLNSLMAPELKTEMVLLNAEGFRNIILDMTNVAFIDSSGLSSILIANRLCKNDNGSFVMTCVNESVMKLIKISQLDGILTILPTVSEASDFILIEEIERGLKEDSGDDQ